MRNSDKLGIGFDSDRTSLIHLLLVVKLISQKGKLGSLLDQALDVGLAIIFSTIALVSESRSLSFEFSGVILVVSILG